MSHLILAAMLLFIQPAHAAGETVSLTASGLAVIKTAGEKIGKALEAAFTILGGGYVPSNGSGRFIVPFHPGFPGWGDDAVIEIQPVSPDANPRPISPLEADTFGNADGRSPSDLGYSQRTYETFGTNDNRCGSAYVKNTIGTCNGVITSMFKESKTHYAIYGSNATPWWYHPNCSCAGSCEPGSGGCPYTVESPCVPLGTGIDYAQINYYTYCADPGETATSMPFPDLGGYRPAGEFQPEAHAPADLAATAAAKVKIADAIAWMDSNTSEAARNDPTTNVGKTYAALNDGSISLNTPTVLTIGQYTYPVGSPALATGSCSTCGVTSPSTAPLQNVWIQNGQLHVWIDNPPAAASSSFTVITSSVMTLANADVLSVSSFSYTASTETLASVYADFLATRSTNALLGMLANFTIAVSSDVAPFDTNFCIPVPARFGGEQCLDINAAGYWAALVFILHWSVVASSVVAAYFIIYG